MKRALFFLVLFLAVYAVAVIVPAVIFADTGQLEQASGAEKLGTQLVVNYLAVVLIQGAKKWKAPFMAWIGEHTPIVNRIAATIAATATAAGITGSFEAGTLTITGLTAAGLAHFAVHFVQSWAAMKITYKVLHPSNPPAVAPAT